MKFGFITFIFLTFFYLLSQSVYAHDLLLNLSKDQMTQVQQNLIDKKYLLPNKNFKFGIYDAQTEEAFNKFQIDRDKEYFQSIQNDNSQTSTDTGTVTLGETTNGWDFFTNLWAQIISTIRSW